ncbi:transcription antitermination factor NusB [Candidatus Curtissbacteria bacterium]|nr:transcription antitermination factor NusB [Candidatus Curtissbacteria bacterium]
MKRKSDPRHLTRTQAVKTLFAKGFRQNLKVQKASLAGQVLQKKGPIDKLIEKNASAWPINQINPIDLATLRLAIFELLFKNKKEPYKVIIDEAVEIAKSYGSETSSSFVNGVLGSIVKSKVKVESQSRNVN